MIIPIRLQKPLRLGMMMVVGAALLALGWLLLSSPAPLQAAPPAQSPDTTPSISGGQGLWQENCQPCHGPTGAGDGPTAQAIEAEFPNFADPAVARQRVPAQDFDVIKNGRMERMMPPWGNRLSDEQIWDTAAYVWRLGTSAESLTAGELIYTERCAACHGPTGAGDGPEAPANMVDFTDLDRMVEKSQVDLQAGFGGAATHTDLSVSETEVWQALDYIRTFSYAYAVPQNNGLLSGQLLNATTNEPLANLPITLRLVQGQTEVDQFTTQTDAEGRYQFEQLPTDHSTLYYVESTYQDVVYLSDPGIFTPDSTETTVDLNVYDTTTDASNISLNRLNYLVSFAHDAAQIIQLFSVSNNGDKSYTGQNGHTFTFELPAEAANVSFQEDPAYPVSEIASGYATNEPVLPGQEGLVIVALYSLPIEGDTLAVEIPLPADVPAVNVLMEEQGVTLSSDQLEFTETRQAQGAEFSIYQGSNLSQETPLRLELSGLDDLELTPLPQQQNSPAASGSSPLATASTHLFDQSLLRWLVLGLAGVLVLGVGLVYPYLRPQLTAQTAHHQDPTIQRQKLVMLLAQLDESFAAGDLDEAVYYRARNRYKAELAEILEA